MTLTQHVLRPVQALDSLIITDAELLAAQPHTSDWHRAVEAGDLAYSTTEANNDSRGSRAAAGRNTAGEHACIGARGPLYLKPLAAVTTVVRSGCHSACSSTSSGTLLRL